MGKSSGSKELPPERGGLGRAATGALVLFGTLLAILSFFLVKDNQPFLNQTRSCLMGDEINCPLSKKYIRSVQEYFDEIESALKNRRLTEADQKTHQVLCALIKQSETANQNKLVNQRCLLYEDDVNRLIKNYYEYLVKIDSVWMQNTQCRYGFSIQQDIWTGVIQRYHGLDQQYPQFSQSVGWERIRDDYYPSDAIKYDGRAPTGHLPSIVVYEPSHLIPQNSGVSRWGSVVIRPFAAYFQPNTINECKPRLNFTDPKSLP